MPHFGGVITRPELALYPLRLSFSGTEDLAQASAVWVATIRRAELVEGQTSMPVPNESAVRRALEAAGIEFIDEKAADEECGCESGSRKKIRRLNGLADRPVVRLQRDELLEPGRRDPRENPRCLNGRRKAR